MSSSSSHDDQKCPLVERGSAANVQQQARSNSSLDKDPNILTSFDNTRMLGHNQSITSLDHIFLDKPPKKQEGLTPVLLLAVMAAVIGSSTQFGFNSGVINNPKEAIQQSFSNSTHQFNDLEMNIAVSIFAVGGMIGAVPAGLVANIMGRKYTLLLNNVLVIVAVALQSFAVHPVMFILGRFVIGINAGVNTVVVPMYISEISPLSLRGALGVCHQMAIVSSILLSQILSLNIIFGRSDSVFHSWRFLFSVSLLFAIFQLIVLPWLPESPKHLFITCKQEANSIKALQRLRGNADITEELKLMKDEANELASRAQVTLKQFITTPHLRRALLVSVVLHLSQQFSGIIGIFYYSSDIFRAALVPHADIATVLTVGLVLVVVTIITIFVIEVLGRRTLMLYGLGGMAIFFTLLTSMFCFQDGFYGNNESSDLTVPGILLVVSSLGVVTLFALGPGAIPWLMVAELFMQEARPVALTIATMVNWMANSVVGIIFPYVLEYLYPYGTIIFTITCTTFWIYLYYYLPETKGQSEEHITNKFKNSNVEKATLT